MSTKNLSNNRDFKTIQSKFITREYVKGDKDSILNLFKTTFQTVKKGKHWDWQFNENQQGASWITLAFDNSKTIAQYCIFRQHLNYMGNEIVAGQSCDTMVHPEYRRNGLFTKLAQRNYRYAENSKLQAVIGFPGRSSYPGFMKKLKWNNIASMTSFDYRIGLKRQFGPFVDKIYKILLFIFLHIKLKYNISKVTHKFRIKRYEIIPERLESLLKEHRDHEVLSVWKNIKYLKWRYQNHPVNHYTFFISSFGKSDKTLIVCRKVGNNIAICEFIYKDRNLLENTIALQSIVQYYVRRGKQNIKFFGHDRGFFNAVFKNAGFKSELAGDFVFGGRVFNNNSLSNNFNLATNWTIMYGDTDTI